MTTTEHGRITLTEWQARLQQLACEAGENDAPNLELGFLCLYRASKLPQIVRRGLANAAMLLLGTVEDATHAHHKERAHD